MQFLKTKDGRIYLLLSSQVVYNRKSNICYNTIFDLNHKKTYKLRENTSFFKEYKTFKPGFFKKTFYILKYRLWAKK